MFGNSSALVTQSNLKLEVNMQKKGVLLLSTALGLMAAAVTSHATDSCSWVTPAEYAAIVGGKADGKPVGNEETCTVSFDRYQRTAQVQLVSGFGMSDRYAGLVKFWQEENARIRKSGGTVEEKAIGDAFCSARVPTMTSPTTECMQELPGKRVLYARLTAPNGTGKAPPMETTLKLLTTALPKAK
ncbi:MAG: hypothetical protein ACM32F_04450 [Betaproteobacteria bacterium]